MDVTAIFSMVTNAVSAYKAAVELKDEAQIIAATNELQMKLSIALAHVIAVQEKDAERAKSERALLTRIHELEDQTRDLEKRIADRERYELVEDYPGTLALRLKESCQNGEPMHYLCPGCLDNKQVKSILQFYDKSKRLAHCPACTQKYRFADDPPLRISRPTSDWRT
ncbi:hypothetical protein [Achromobacter sp. DH1f]|uniref:hypothetical protein n=1 Tax=Achromobacter sp. DH1f TaxID=1397275 RepID=UPI00046865EB|nr:hypothetical protein [Achromobacter sp. DH1f]